MRNKPVGDAAEETLLQLPPSDISTGSPQWLPLLQETHEQKRFLYFSGNLGACVLVCKGKVWEAVILSWR